MKYEVTHTCGHTQTVQLFGKSSDRERRLNWLEHTICAECWKKKQQDAFAQNALKHGVECPAFMIGKKWNGKIYGQKEKSIYLDGEKRILSQEEFEKVRNYGFAGNMQDVPERWETGFSNDGKGTRYSATLRFGNDEATFSFVTDIKITADYLMEFFGREISTRWGLACSILDGEAVVVIGSKTEKQLIVSAENAPVEFCKLLELINGDPEPKLSIRDVSRIAFATLHVSHEQTTID